MIDLKFPPLATSTIAVIGLGYVGLPLAVAFATPGTCKRKGTPLNRKVIGFDINRQRLAELRDCNDRTNETNREQLKSATLLKLTDDPSELINADVFVVTVPTPIDNSKRPDLRPLKKASITVGNALKNRALNSVKNAPVIIYESTVYPGATEEICVPILEKESCLRFNQDFFCGYSPERINPGDTTHGLTSIIKVTSGSTQEAAEWVDAFYGSIITAGTHMTTTIAVAEAAKVIENTQRDLNIALVNELSIIFRKLNIDTLDVLEAAGTKWNFLPFRPGLVGGHCIGVDPYYLTHKAEEIGYHPQLVLAGRRINDGMGRLVVDQLVLEMAKRGHVIAGTQVLTLGLTFKENCPDLRNTRVLDVVEAMQNYGMESVIVDPWADPNEAKTEYGLTVLNKIPAGRHWRAILVLVAHNEFAQQSTAEWSQLLQPDSVLIDLKGIVPRESGAIRF